MSRIFKDTLMYKICITPLQEWEKSCLYMFIMKIPGIVFFVVLGIIVALIYDFFVALHDIGG